MKTNYKGVLAMIFVVLESALMTIALQVGGSNIGTIPFLFYSFLLGTITMFIITSFLKGWNDVIGLLKSKRSLVVISLGGLLGLGLNTIALTLGTLGTTPSISGIVFRTYPLIAAILAVLILKEKMSKRQLLGLLIGFVSVYVVLSNGNLTTINFSEAPYIALVLFSALFAAVAIIAIKRYNTSSVTYVLLANISSLLFILLIILIFHINIAVNPSMPTIAAIGLIGIIELAVGDVLFYYCFKTLGTSVAGLAMFTVPFFTIGFSFWLLGTPLQTYYFVAAGVLTIGAYINQTTGARKRKR